MREAIVVGCGVSGLSSAIRLAEAGFSVTIVARERTPNTTSDIAAAVWYPFRCGTADRGLAWSRRTFRVLRDLARDPETGVTLVEGIDLLQDADAGTPWWKDAVERFRAADRSEIPDASPAAWIFEAPVVAMPKYMKWLEAKAASHSIAIQTRTVESLDALLTEAGIVVNCAGLGARELTNDETLVPIRGQVVRVEPGHTRRFIQGGGADLAYVIPRQDCTVLGGTQDINEWDRTVIPETAEAIRQRCIALEPDLANAKVLSHAVGLRPGRPEPRLETEHCSAGTIVHNYGHGGGGVTLSWGCAEEVVRRVQAAVAAD